MAIYNQEWYRNTEGDAQECQLIDKPLDTPINFDLSFLG